MGLIKLAFVIMKIIITILLLIGSAKVYCAANEDIDALLYRFSQAKITESCRLFNQLLKTQSTKQIDGLSEFLIDFWTAEAEKQGYTLEDFAKECVTTTNNYTEFLQAMESIRERSEKNVKLQ